MEFKRYVKISSGIVMIFPIVLLILAAMAWPENVCTGIIYLALGVVQLVGLVLLYPRIMKLEDIMEIGNKFVQHNWLVLSVGLSGGAIVLAPFFKIDSTAIPYIAFTVCILSALLSGFNLYKAVKEARARLVV